MTARITGFVTRDQAALRRPKSISRNIDPSRGGVTFHHGGGPQRLGPSAPHADCLRRWAAWQRFHMDTRGWSDIAYTGGVCDHGYAFAGRGAFVRTGANGTNTGNAYYYAVVWLGGEGETPTQAARDAFDWWVVELRKAGRAGRRVVPHSFHKATACPGGPLKAYAALLDNADPAPAQPAPAPAPAPAPSDPDKRAAAAMDTLDLRNAHATPLRGRHVDNLQGLLVAAANMPGLSRVHPGAVDGIAGAKTRTALLEFQRAAKYLGAYSGADDAIVGPGTWHALITF